MDQEDLLQTQSETVRIWFEELIANVRNKVQSEIDVSEVEIRKNKLTWFLEVLDKMEQDPMDLKLSAEYALWVESLISEEIKSIQGIRSNEQIWEKGSFYSSMDPHTENIALLDEYLSFLHEILGSICFTPAIARCAVCGRFLYKGDSCFFVKVPENIAAVKIDFAERTACSEDCAKKLQEQAADKVRTQIDNLSACLNKLQESIVEHKKL